MDESDIVVNKRKYIESMGKSKYESFIDEVKQSISKLSHIFQTNPIPIDAEKHPEIEVGIETTGDPVRSRQYMLSPQCKNAVREFVSKLLKLKLIRKSSSPWASPLLAVRKPDGVSWRVCLDARKLNEQTVRMAYPMQRADEALRSLRGATIFSTCDATSGFWQLPLKEKDKKKTAFHSPLGLYEFEVMPFGLINAPSHFAKSHPFWRKLVMAV
jgi:putative transposase